MPFHVVQSNEDENWQGDESCKPKSENRRSSSPISSLSNIGPPELSLSPMMPLSPVPEDLSISPIGSPTPPPSKSRKEIVNAESRKHYGRTVIDRRKVGKTMEIWRKVCQNRDLNEGLDKYFNNKN